MEINEDGTVNIAFGNYVAGRMERFVRQQGSQIAETPEAGLLFGQPVANLVEWAEVAANSEPFARKLVLDYWRLLVGDDPQPGDEPEFARLVQRVDEVHRIVLGGVEPYTLGVREPLPLIAVTAPIAQDRVALAACTERIERDLAALEPLLLTKVDVDAPTPGQLEVAARRFFASASCVGRRRPTRSALWHNFTRR